MTNATYNTGALDLDEGDQVPLQIDSAGRLKVTASGTGTSSDQVQGAAAHGAAAAGNPVMAGGVFDNAYGTLDTGDVGRLRLGASGNLKVELTLAGATTALTANTVTADNSAAVGLAVSATPKAVTSGGLTPLRVVTGTSGVVKASVGQLYTLTAYNSNAAVRYLHLYNKATAPTLSTDTPVYTVPLPAAGRIDINFTAIGLAFATGIAWAYTTDDIGIPATAATSAELHFSATYK